MIGTSLASVSRPLWRLLARYRLDPEFVLRESGLDPALMGEPRLVLLDEPLNGLDPMARAEVTGVFEEFAHDGGHVIISSHILHEVDLVSDNVVMLHHGYVVAEGDIQAVRSEISSKGQSGSVAKARRPTMASVAGTPAKSLATPKTVGATALAPIPRV